MRFYPLKSFLMLILIGFVVVTLPLLVALGLAAMDVEKLADQSQHAIYQAVRITQASRALVEQIPDMERSARQSLVLSDPSLFRTYTEKHKKFQSVAQGLATQPLSTAQRNQLTELTIREQKLFDTLKAHAFPAQGSENAIAQQFTELGRIARMIWLESSRLIDRESAVLQREAADARRIFIWFGVAFIPAAVLFAAVFTILISRPIRQIDRAIRRLGDGEFSVPVHVRGPQDLQYLGQRLDWLRVRLVELEGEKNRLLRNVSHELKTPLAAIRESAELLADEVVGRLNPQQRDITAILRDNSLALQRLIESLLTFGLMHLRTPALELHSVDLTALVERVVANHKPTMLAKSIRLDLQLAPVTVDGDEDKLRTVVDNLLSNAVKYSPRGGTVQVTLAATDGEVTLDVRDSGPGVDPADRARVFDAFYQGRAAQDVRIQGTGLGLAIAQECAAAHGGRIELVDAGEGGGYFRVILPVHQTRNAA